MVTRIHGLDGEWFICADPLNTGLKQRWFREPRKEAKATRVPGIIQEVYPGYHGIAWYWKDFTPPRHHSPHGRYLLRLWAVDYAARVWVNSRPAGRCEGGETPAVIDITEHIVPESANRLCIRVLNPTNEPIDGMRLAETPHRNKGIPYRVGGSYNYGGITESVELISVPRVHLSDVFAKPHLRTGIVEIRATVRNAGPADVKAKATFAIAPATGGRILDSSSTETFLRVGETLLQSELRVQAPRRWDLHDPFLYRVTVILGAEVDSDEQSVRCGFRELRVAGGFFQLNGRRVFVRSAHTGNHCPVGQIIPPPGPYDMLRRDLIYAKACGFNMVRFIAGVAHPWQLDLCDEIGLMVYEESLAGWCLEDSPRMRERFRRSVTEMILRDRNHPSVVIWGLLNETKDGPVFRQAVDSLGMVRRLDDTRLVLLNSGRWDGRFSIGSVSNPGSLRWEPEWGDEDPDHQQPFSWGEGGYAKGAGDAHVYPSTPHTDASVDLIRRLGHESKPVFLSEYGIGSLLNAIQEMRKFEEGGFSPDLEDHSLMKSMAEAFLADWKAMELDGIYPFPEDLLRDSQRLHCRQRLFGFDLIRANPRICGFNITGMLDHGMTGEGLWTFWREFKPGMMDALRDGWAPLRWCTFVRPMHGYADGTFQIAVVLANEDILPPGDYPVCVRVNGPNGITWEKRATLSLDPCSQGIRQLSVPVLKEGVELGGQGGVYELAVDLERGGAPAGGRLRFHATSEGSFPDVQTEILTWGIDQRITEWLGSKGVRIRTFPSPTPGPRIMVIGDSVGESSEKAWGEIVRRVRNGSGAIFLSPRAFKEGNDRTAHLPLKNKGRIHDFSDWLYHKECVAKSHPIFEGLQCGGIMDWDYYGPIIPHAVFEGVDLPDEVVAAAFAVGYTCPSGYSSGILVGVYRLGKGMLIINTLNILENIRSHPAADRLLLNMIAYAAAMTRRD